MTTQRAQARKQPTLPHLVERDEEVARLASAVRLVDDSDAAIILVVGEIGSGKSELLRAALDIAEAGDNRDSFRALVACHPSDIPYAPWMTVIEGSGPIGDEIPEPLGAHSPPAQGPHVLIQRASRAFRNAARRQPIALLFDDIQWTDESTLDLLLSMARQADELPLTLILSCETPLREGEPIARFVPTLLRETSAQSIELGSLSREGIRQIVAQRFPDIAAGLNDELTRHVEQWSGGNPLYVLEMLAGISGAQDIANALAAPRVDSLSFSLKQLAEYRLEQLSPATRETIELASIIGDAFDLDLLAAVSDRCMDDLIRELEEALDAGVLAEERDGRLRFRYGVVRQLLVENQSNLRRRQRHRAVFNALQQSRKASSSPLDFARHAEAAGDLDVAVDAFERAGHQATLFFNMPEAGQHYRKALDLAEAAGSDPAYQDTLRLQYADCLVRRDVTAAIREYEKVAGRADVRGDAAMRGRARQRHATILYEIGRRNEARDILDDLIPDLQAREDWQTLADALVCALYCAALESDFASVDIFVENLESIFDKVDNAGYRALALAMKATADVARGQPARASSMMRQAITIAEEIGQYDIAAPYSAVTFMRVDLFGNLHRPEQIHELIAWGQYLDAEGNRRAGLPADKCDCTPEFALWYFLRGEWNRIDDFLLDPIAVHDEPQPQPAKDNVTVIGAEYAFARGNADEASKILDYIAPTPLTPIGGHGYQPWLMAVDLRARIAIAAGDLDGAQEWIHALDRELEHKTHVPGELMLDLNRVRIFLANNEPKQAAQLAEAVVAGARRTHNILALIDGLQLLGRSLAAQGDNNRATAAAEEAIVVARRCQLSYLEALGRITFMELGSSLGAGHVSQTEVEALREEMRELGARRAEDRLTALLRKLSNMRPGGLTRREIDVLKLIVEGKTDNEIAELLFISPRTVSTHVGNMLAKTDTINRVELSTWAHQNNALK